LSWSKADKATRISITTPLAMEGLSGSQIAERLGTTRLAIIGFCYRNGIQLRGKQTSGAPPAPEPVLVLPKLGPAVPNDLPLAGSTPTPLLETTGCRWPVEGGFCNHTLHKKLYCATHHKMAYRPAAPVHPLLIKLATLGPQKPKTYAGCQAYNGLVRDRLVMFRVGADGQSTFYLTDLGRENTLGY
jgi:hypothetical protein